MNRLAVVLAAASFAITGCGKEDPPLKPEVTAKDVKKEAQEAAAAATQYAHQEKDEFIKSSEQAIEELKTKMGQLTERIQTASVEAKAKVDPQLETLEAKWKSARTKLDELKQSSGEAWKEIKQGLSDAMADLKRSYEEAVEKFKENA